MKVDRIGTLKEHLDGRIDLQYWVFDCACCSFPHEAANKHRDELIGLAKKNGTYSFEMDDIPMGIPFA